MSDNLPICFSEKEVVARKEHSCCECSCKIQKGDKYILTKGIWEDGAASYKTCKACYEVYGMLEDPPVFEEGFDEKVLVKACQEVLHALGLGDYSVRTTPSYGKWGDCNWVKRKIRLSELLFLNSKVMKNHEEAYDTIIHEVAHACRPLCAHGKKWKSLMEKLNRRPKGSKPAHISVRSRIPYKFVLIDKESNKVIKGWTRNCKKVKEFMGQNEKSPKYLCMAHDGSPVDLA